MLAKWRIIRRKIFLTDDQKDDRKAAGSPAGDGVSPLLGVPVPGEPRVDQEVHHGQGQKWDYPGEEKSIK